MEPKTPNYLVVSTDYTSYAVVYSCEKVKGLPFAFLWYLSRTPEVTPEKKEMFTKIATAALPNFNFDLVAFDVQGNDVCAYDPPPTSLVPPEVDECDDCMANSESTGNVKNTGSVSQSHKER